MENTAKNFALQLGSLVALYVSLTSLLVLLFGIINIAFPDAAEGYWQVESASTSIRFSMATLIVFFPAYIVLTRMVNTIRRNESGTYLTLTKWLIYLSLLVGGAVILGDLVAVLNAFLNGEITERFILKALSVLVVIGAAFFYYLQDARGHWQTHEKQSIQYAGVTTMVVIAVLILGFFHTETPSEVREGRIDSEQINDLQSIQWRIEEYYNLEGTLPASIDNVFRGIEAPRAPEGRSAYEYNITEDGFELCAEFARKTANPDEFSYARPMAETMLIKNPDNWDHDAGWWCFERVIQAPN